MLCNQAMPPPGSHWASPAPSDSGCASGNTPEPDLLRGGPEPAAPAGDLLFRAARPRDPRLTACGKAVGSQQSELGRREPNDPTTPSELVRQIHMREAMFLRKRCVIVVCVETRNRTGKHRFPAIYGWKRRGSRCESLTLNEKNFAVTAKGNSVVWLDGFDLPTASLSL